MCDPCLHLRDGHRTWRPIGRLRSGEVGLDPISFAWAGEFDRGQKHYYRVQRPTFLIELDNTQDDTNPVQTVWRDFEGDFGRDLLREHLSNTPH